MYMCTSSKLPKGYASVYLEDMPTGTDNVNVSIHESGPNSQAASHGLKPQSKYKLKPHIFVSHDTARCNPGLNRLLYEKREVDDGNIRDAPLTERLRKMGVGVIGASRCGIKCHQG